MTKKVWHHWGYQYTEAMPSRLSMEARFSARIQREFVTRKLWLSDSRLISPVLLTVWSISWEQKGSIMNAYCVAMDHGYLAPLAQGVWPRSHPMSGLSLSKVYVYCCSWKTHWQAINFSTMGQSQVVIHAKVSSMQEKIASSWTNGMFMGGPSLLERQCASGMRVLGLMINIGDSSQYLLIMPFFYYIFSTSMPA